MRRTLWIATAVIGLLLVPLAPALGLSVGPVTITVDTSHLSCPSASVSTKTEGPVPGEALSVGQCIPPGAFLCVASGRFTETWETHGSRVDAVSGSGVCHSATFTYNVSFSGSASEIGEADCAGIALGSMFFDVSTDLPVSASFTNQTTKQTTVEAEDWVAANTYVLITPPFGIGVPAAAPMTVSRGGVVVGAGGMTPLPLGSGGPGGCSDPTTFVWMQTP